MGKERGRAISIPRTACICMGQYTDSRKPFRSSRNRTLDALSDLTFHRMSMPALMSALNSFMSGFDDELHMLKSASGFLSNHSAVGGGVTNDDASLPHSFTDQRKRKAKTRKRRSWMRTGE